MTDQSKHIKKFTSINKRIISFSNICSIFSIFLLILLLKNPIIAHISVSNSLKQCVSFIIPSLFPLMIASEIATESGAINSITQFLQAPISKIFGVSKNATPPFFLGLVGGYVSSVNSAISLYKNGKISRNDCERMICFSNFPSLAFFINFIGIGIYKNSTVGWVLWLISILSSVLIGILEQIIIKFFTKSQTHTPPQLYVSNDTASKSSQIKSISKIIVSAISHSAQSMLIICGCIVFFSTLIDIIKYPIDSLCINEEIKHIILGSIELTNGINSCINLKNSIFKIGSIAFFVGWSGICVHFQIISLCENTDLSFKKYFLFKLLHGLICSIITILVI